MRRGKMASLTPARVIGLGSKKGKIEKDFDADLIMFDDDINISFVMVGGSVVNRERKKYYHARRTVK